MMGFGKSYTALFHLFLKEKKTFIIVGLVTFIMSVIFSSPYFIPPKFESNTAIYPSNLINYSTESPTEQLLQLFYGNDVRDSIILKYDLINHYNIDTTSEGYKFRLYNEFNDNISIKKTNFESVYLKVLDVDPVLSMKIVQELVKQVNNKISILHQSKAKEVVVITRNQLEHKMELIDTLEAQIKRYSLKYGLLDYTQQSREVTAGYMNMLHENKKGESMQKVEKLFENLKEKGSYIQDLHHQSNLAREDYNKILIRYDEAMRDVNKKLTYTNTIIFPEVADEKAYPIRWLIVLLSLSSSILFTYIVLLFNNRLKHN